MTSANGIENEAADIASLLDANQLDYRLAPSLSIATSRSMRSYPALQSTYTMGDKITIVPSTGATFGDLANSFLAFDLVFINNTAAPNYQPIDGARIPGYCGYAQMFSDYAITHSSGVEMDRQTSAVGEWVQIEQYYNMSHQKRRIQGSTYLHNESPWPMCPIIDTSAAYDEACKSTWYLPDMNGTKVIQPGTLTPAGVNMNQFETQWADNLGPPNVFYQVNTGPAGSLAVNRPLVVAGTQADFGAGLAISRTFGPGPTDGETQEPQWEGLLPISSLTTVTGQNGIRNDPQVTDAIDPVAPFPTSDDTWRQKYARVNQPTRNGISVVTGSTTAPVTNNVATYVSGWQSGFKEDQDLSGKRVHVVIPLTHILPIFRNNLLAPPYLIAGLRIELGTYAKETFFQTVTVINSTNFNADYKQFTWNPLHSVQIQNPVINFETFTLTDAITRKIAQISAASGLEWSWDAIHQSFTTTSSQTFSYQINRAISRANIVVVKTRSVNNLSDPAENYFASDPWNSPVNPGRSAIPPVYPTAQPAAGSPSTADQLYDGTMSNFQVQLGALYIPSQPILLTSEFLHSALKTFCQFRRNDEVGGVPLFQFIGQAYSIAPLETDLVSAVAQASGGANPVYPLVSLTSNFTNANFSRFIPSLAISCVPLESSSTLQQSGAAISAARTAIVNMAWQYVRNENTSRRVDLFVTYTKLATLLLDSVVIRT
jgi:hypothetical protein